MTDATCTSSSAAGIEIAFSVFFFICTLVTGPKRSLSLKLGDTRVYEPQIRARLGTTTLFGGVIFNFPALHSSRRNRATCGTNQEARNRRFGPAGDGGRAALTGATCTSSSAAGIRTASFRSLDLPSSTLESGGLLYKSGGLKETIRYR